MSRMEGYSTKAQVCQETGLTIPNEPIFSGDTRAFTHLYLDNFGKLFTHRQLLALMTCSGSGWRMKNDAASMRRSLEKRSLLI